MFRRPVLPRLYRRAALAVIAFAVLPGCTVVTVASTVVGVAASGTGLAVDAGVGAARITGRAIGATADAVLPGGN